VPLKSFLHEWTACCVVNNDSGTHLTTIFFLSNNHRDMDNLNLTFRITTVTLDCEKYLRILEHYQISFLGIEFDLLEKIEIHSHVRNWPICSV
jgi:hypothetical protein